MEVITAEPWCEQALPGSSYTSWPSQVETIALDGNGDGGTSGDLALGSCMNLDFASTSQVACFPATENEDYMGNHVFYALAEPLPPKSTVTIAVTPEPDVDVSLYGLQTGATNYYVPPKVPSAVSCEASNAAGVGYVSNPGATEWITFTNPSNSNMYNIFFAVAGSGVGSTVGSYTVTVHQDTAAPYCPMSLPGETFTSWPEGVNVIALTDGHYSGSNNMLDAAANCVNLDWAANSSVACFPSTQNAAFEGKQVYYALEDPLPPLSEVTIQVTPKTASQDVNLYGYQMGTSSYLVPPNVPSVVSCEASYAPSSTNPGDAEFITFTNPSTSAYYNIFFAVTQPDTTGAFDVTVDQYTAEPWCPESLPGQSYTDWPASVNVLSLSGTTATTSGNLGSGDCVNLDFAWDSSVACFPAPQADHFKGNHVFYALDVDVQGGQTITVEATPSGPGKDISLYGYLAGSHWVPPMVPSVLSCEASYPYTLDGSGNPGAKETIQFAPAGGGSYKLFFAVAGTSTGGTTGMFDVTVTVD